MTTQAYATLENVRTWGITTAQATDTVVADRLGIASTIVDDYCGWSGYGLGGAFATPVTTTITVSDVRLPLLPLPNPFNTITQVTVDGSVISSSAYTVEKWGLRMYISGYYDVDGFPNRALSDLGYGGVLSRFSNGTPYGSKVAVSATFGYSVTPLPVRHATVLIAAFLIFGQGETLLDPRVNSLEVEGYKVGYPRKGGPDSELLDTTGVIEADRLLAPYAGLSINVA